MVGFYEIASSCLYFSISVVWWELVTYKKFRIGHFCVAIVFFIICRILHPII